MNKTIYIPGFGNQDDKIRKSAFPDAKIVQKSMRIISLDKASRYIGSVDEDELRAKIKERYPSATDEDFLFLMAEIMKFQRPNGKIDKTINDSEKSVIQALECNNTIKFQGFTRKIDTTINITKKLIMKGMNGDCMIKLAGHSQGGLVAVEMILKHPELLEKISEIELFAPVGNYKIGRGFHYDEESGIFKKGYINRKGVIVRSEYVDSLDVTDYSLLICLAIRLKTCGYAGKWRIIYSENDPVIPAPSLELDAVKRIFPEAEIINTKASNHYLGY